MNVARVQARGQVTIPQEVREACGVTPGSDLFFVKLGPGRFECRVLPARRSLVEITKQYTMDGTAPDIAQLREEMAEQLAGTRLPGSQGS